MCLQVLCNHIPVVHYHWLSYETLKPLKIEFLPHLTYFGLDISPQALDSYFLDLKYYWRPHNTLKPLEMMLLPHFQEAFALFN
jgi:hypothetical protein